MYRNRSLSATGFASALSSIESVILQKVISSNTCIAMYASQIPYYQYWIACLSMSMGSAPNCLPFSLCVTSLNWIDFLHKVLTTMGSLHQMFTMFYSIIHLFAICLTQINLNFIYCNCLIAEARQHFKNSIFVLVISEMYSLWWLNTWCTIRTFRLPGSTSYIIPHTNINFEFH